MEISFCFHAMAVVCIISLLVFLLVFLYDARRNAVFERLSWPGPKPTSYIKNLFYRRKTTENLHCLQLEHMQKYGKIFTWYYGNNPDIVVGDPETLRQLFSAHIPNFRENTRESIYGQQYLFDDKVRVFAGNNIRRVVCLIDEAIDTFCQKVHGVANTGMLVKMIYLYFENDIFNIIRVMLSFNVF